MPVRPSVRYCMAPAFAVQPLAQFAAGIAGDERHIEGILAVDGGAELSLPFGMLANCFGEIHGTPFLMANGTTVR
jgi:hypothetical protein